MAKIHFFPAVEVVDPRVDSSVVLFIFAFISGMTLVKQQDDSHVRFQIFIYSLKLKTQNFPAHDKISLPQDGWDTLFPCCESNGCKSGCQCSFHVHTNLGDDFNAATG